MSPWASPTTWVIALFARASVGKQSERRRSPDDLDEADSAKAAARVERLPEAGDHYEVGGKRDLLEAA